MMNTFEDAHTSSKMLIMESVSTFVSIFGLVIFGGPCPHEMAQPPKFIIAAC
jgi:hypothetical protein